MSFRILVGDCRDSLKSLADQSVQCCVTSPPYYGLRDYGTGAWDGGDASCSHTKRPGGTGGDPKYGANKGCADGAPSPMGDTCIYCGAIRVDRQLGLEKTPAEYVEKMVQVFREVRRVLRDDGTLWLNIGSSYASSVGERDYGSYDGVTGRGPGARRYRNAPACGTDGKALQGSPATGSSYSDLCDGCRDAIRNHHGRTAGSGQHPEPSERPDERTVRGTVPSASWPEGKAVELPSALASTTLESSPQPPVVCSHCSNCGACLSVLRSVLRDSRLCVRSSVYSDGIARILPLSGVRNGDREPSFSAYSNIASLRFKPKDLIPIPWMLAMALQADGWYLRSDIIWSKSNPMPESVTDRPTKSHEYLFLLSKSPTYYYDAEAIREPIAPPTGSGGWQTARRDGDPARYEGKYPSKKEQGQGGADARVRGRCGDPDGGRNARSVWTIATTPYTGAHFATFPPKLIEPCILAGSKKGDTVLDPFGGAGTTGLVADRLGRDSILCELNEQYAEMARKRITDDAPLFAERLGA